ncbi:MAG TPA: hypothetical protein VMI15_04740 [Burkholderiales bacterium]|nr:hypothetical protein [Burkholderiales bacterium]
METLYEHLRRGEAYAGVGSDGSALWVSDARLASFTDSAQKLNVTGYSLGGHLATVFTELHPGDVLQTYTFNGAGRGQVANDDVASMVAFFRQVLADPDAAPTPAVDTPARLFYDAAKALEDAPIPSGIYEDPRYKWATYATATAWGLGSGILAQPSVERTGYPFDKITQIYGLAAQDDSLLVANSGTHGPGVKIFIEDQPDFVSLGGIGQSIFPDAPGDFGITHSITLLADSLAVMRAMQTLDPQLDLDTMYGIFSASSNLRASGSMLESTSTVEGESLENVLDGLRRLFLGADVPDTPRGNAYGSFSDPSLRDPFYENLGRLSDAIQPFAGALTIAPLAASSAAELAALAESGAAAKAYRYALTGLDPFVVLGSDGIFDRHNQHGELDVVDAATGQGSLTAEYIEDRARFLSLLLERNARNSPASPAEPLVDAALGARWTFSDVARGIDLVASPGVAGAEIRVARFGSSSSDTLIGDVGGDRLYGGAGADELRGQTGDDYLEGGTGEDLLDGGPGDDVLDGQDGASGDRLLGGTGNDTFYADWGDVVADDPEERGGIVYVGPDRLQLGDAYRAGSSGFFSGPDGVRYWEGTDGRIVAYLPGDAGGQLTIEAPLTAVPGRESLSGTIVSGRPDLGIRLVSEVDDRPQPRPLSANDAIPSLWAQAQTWRPFADPLALDLDGDGIETLGGPAGRAVLFDHTGDGARDGTGWLAPDDGWLALDRDGDGLISKGSELFGVDTLLPNGTKAPNGFAALAPLDTTGDGTIDAADALFDELLVWRDANSNGLSEPFEMQSLEQAGIAAIRLSAETVGNPLPGGNTLLQRGMFVREDGSTGIAASLNLVRETYYRDIAVAPASAAGDLSLPNVAGSGRVRDLQEAAAESSDLAQALADAANAPTREEQLSEVDGLLTRWAQSSSMPSGADAALARTDSSLLYYYFSDLPTPAARDVYAGLTGGVATDPASLPKGWYLTGQSDAYRERIRKLEILERFTGRTFVDVANTASVLELASGPYQLRTIPVSISPGNWQYVEDAYAALQDSVYLAIAAQTRLAPYVDAFLRGQGARDFSEIEGLLAARRAADPVAALGDLYDLARTFGAELVGRGWITMPSMLAQWASELGADPALGSAVAALGIRTRVDYQTYGGPASDVILGSDWVPPPAPLPGVRSTYGGFGDDILFGGEPRETDIHDGAGRDIVQGGPEFDYLYGGPGEDIYLFGRGSGTDLLQPEAFLTVTDLDRDVLQFLPGVLPSDIVARRVYEPFNGSNSLELRIAGAGDAFIDKYFFRPDGSGNLLAGVRFADGTVWSYQDIRAHASLGTEANDNGTPGNERLLMGSAQDDVIDGRGGDDTLLGDDGDDVLLGGAGLDTLEGGVGDDVLDGGPGHDWLYGGFGIDAYVLSRGGGTDEIFRGNFVTWAGTDVHPELDVIRVADGIAPGEVILQRLRASLRIALTDGSAEMIDYGNPLNPLYAGEDGAPSIGRIEFADGTVWDGAEIRARSLLGATDGGDVLYGFEASGDTLFGLGGDDQLFGLGGADQLSGGDGDDILEGREGDDFLDGGPGDDRLYGGPGTDTFLLRRDGGRDQAYSYNFNQSGGSGTSDELDVVRVEAGIAPEEVVLERFGSDLHIVLSDGSAEIVDHGNASNPRYLASGVVGPAIDRIEFADGTAWDGAEIRSRTVFGAAAGADVIVGFADSDDVLAGLAGDDYLDGQGGDDVLDGGPGDDTLVGGPGADSYLFGPGDGHDVLYDSADDPNTVRLRGVAAGQVFFHGGILELAGSGDTIRLTSAGAIAQVEFPDGSTVALGDLPASAPMPPPGEGGPGGGPPSSVPPVALLDLYGVGEATAGDDFIFGTDGRETIAGGPGNDVLVGRRGSDTYLFDLGDGVDFIVDEADEDGPNILVFGAGIAAGDLQIQPVDDLVLIQVGDTGGIAVWGGLPELRFAEPGPTGEASTSGDGVAAPRAQAAADDAGPRTPEPAETQGGYAVETAPRFRPVRPGPASLQAAGDLDHGSFSRSPATGTAGVAVDPLHREIERQLDILLHVGRPSLGEHYGEAMREFEKRRRQREEPSLPAPSDDEIEAWNATMHAWHDENSGHAETDLGPADGGWALGWGIGGDGALSSGVGATGVDGLPGLVNPRALPRFSGAASPPGVGEGMRHLR